MGGPTSSPVGQAVGFFRKRIGDQFLGDLLIRVFIIDTEFGTEPLGHADAPSFQYMDGGRKRYQPQDLSIFPVYFFLWP